MRITITIFSILICGIVFGQPEVVVNDSIIGWNSNYQLTWSDFLGKPNTEVFGSALTSYKIQVLPSDVLVDKNDRIQGYEDLTVQANFYKYHSWTTVKSKNVLDHEQLHFDIAELFARKMRKRFKEIQDDKEARFSVYMDCYNMFWKDCRAYQKEYDSETGHGRDLDVNKIWAERVQGELFLLEEFK